MKRRIKKINFKRLGIASIIALLVFGITTLYAFADTPFTINVTVKDPSTPGSADKSPVVTYDETGTYVTYDINISNPNRKRFDSMKFKITYDDSKMLPYWGTNGTTKPFSQDRTAYIETVKYVGEINAEHPEYKNDVGFLLAGFTNDAGEYEESYHVGTVKFKVLDEKSGDIDIAIEGLQVLGEGDADITTDFTPKDEDVFIDVPVKESSVSMATSSLEINLGSTDPTAQLVVNYEPKFTTDDKTITATIKSGSATDVVEIQSNGKIKALKAGSTTLVVTAFGKTFEVPVNVVSHVSSVNIDALSKTEYTRSEAQATPIRLNARISPSDATNIVSGSQKWTSSNASMATISNDGTITILDTAKGELTFTYSLKATGSDGVEKEYSDSVSINITVPATNAEITNEDGSSITGKVELRMDQTKTLKAKVTPSDTSDTITWSSNKPEVVTVNNGVLTPVSGGEATITMSVGSITKTVDVKVIVPATGITLDNTQDKITLAVGQNFTLHANVEPATATNRDKIKWTSSNTSVVSVANGTVTAVGAGSAIITAEITEDGVSVTKSFEIVTAVGQVTITDANVNLWTNDDTKDKEKTLTLTTDGAESGSVVWTSSDPSVATVDNNGKVTAVASNSGSAGVATITATWTSNLDSSKVKTAEAEVKVYTSLKEVNVNETSFTLEGKNKTKQLTATMNPSVNSDADKVVWSTSNASVATVDSTGKVTSVGAGTATIKATAGSIEKTINVTVTIPAEEVVIKHNGSVVNKLRVNENDILNLDAEVLPADTTDTTVTWSSSDENIATVDATGKVTAKKEGKVNITATAGKVSKSVEVQVIIPVNTFTFADGSTTLALGDVLRGNTHEIVTKIEPSNATLQDITWTSSDDRIAKVSESGEIKALWPGTVTLTGVLPEGQTVTLTLTVTIKPITGMTVKSESLEVMKNDSLKIELDVEPIDTTEIDQIVWKSEDESIAVVDEAGNVTGKKEGKVKITATYKDITTECEVTVKEIHIESLLLKASKSSLDIGEKLELILDINPSNTTDDLVFTYKSSDENVATVDANGVVTAVGKGTATITVTHENGTESTFEVTVTGNKYTEENKGNGKTPQTSDKSVIYIALTIASFVGCGIVLYKLKFN